MTDRTPTTEEPWIGPDGQGRPSMADEARMPTTAGAELLDYLDAGGKARVAEFILAIEDEARAPLVTALRHALTTTYDAGDEGWRLIAMSDDGGIVTTLPDGLIDAVIAAALSRENQP